MVGCVEGVLLVSRLGLSFGRRCGGACVGNVQTLAKALPCLWPAR
jgi:hypothetical protein